jgi:hypothetical protein
MKVINLVGHPVSVMCTYLLLLISGHSFGGVYVMYMLLGLLHGVLDAIVSAVGLAVMLVGYKIYRTRLHPVKPILYLVANAVMIYGLVSFFQSSKGYNDPTFHQTVSLISFVIYGLCVLCNVAHAAGLLLQHAKKKNNHLNIAA